jgi:uncharacterized SAM-binding protein YcdF (DUF218 family)
LTDTATVSGEKRARRPVRRRWLRRVLIAAVAVVVAFAACTARLIVWPPQGIPARVDAIVVLAGPGTRLPVGVQLASEGHAPVLVVSQGHLGYGGSCPAPITGVRIICFDPNPADTRGEAEYTEKLAKRYGWHSIAVVSTSEQATRAQLIVGRCFNGSVYVVTGSMPWQQVPYQIAYGWAALVKALVLQRSC